MQSCNQCKKLKKPLKCFTIINDKLNKNVILRACKEYVNINKFKYINAKANKIMYYQECVSNLINEILFSCENIDEVKQC